MPSWCGKLNSRRSLMRKIENQEMRKIVKQLAPVSCFFRAAFYISVRKSTSTEEEIKNPGCRQKKE